MNRKETIGRMAWIISGAQGSGKTITALQIASAYLDAFSSPGILPWGDLMQSKFALSTALSDRPAVVIVEGVPSIPSKEERALMKSLATEEKIWIERKGRDRELVAAPVFIFVLTGCVHFSIGSRHFRLVLLP